MKNKVEKSSKVPIIVYDESLDNYKNVVLFPEKLAKANETLKKVGLPDKKALKNYFTTCLTIYLLFKKL